MDATPATDASTATPEPACAAPDAAQPPAASARGGDALPDIEGVAEAFALLDRGLRLLADVGARGDMTALDPDDLITLARRCEAHRTRSITIDSYLVEAAAEDRLHEHVAARGPAAALAQVLGISRAEAHARAARAGQLLPRNGFSNGALPPELPLLADAVADGAVSTCQVRVIGTAMTRLATNNHVTGEDAQRAEAMLVRQAAALGPEDLKIAAAKIDDALLPDGPVPDERIPEKRRGITIGPERDDGTHAIKGYLTRPAKALIDAALGPLAAPHPADPDLPDRSGRPQRDKRTAAQRLHDALEDGCRRLLNCDGLPASGGTPATVHLTIDLERFLTRLHQAPSWAAGRTERAIGAISGGDRITFTDLQRLAREAELIPTWISATGGIVAYGRTRRIATAAQTNALIARDGGCSFPGCAAPPHWCQRHHIIPWWQGGTTDLNNLTLVCGHHHREFEKQGWEVHIQHGIPEWTPPWRIDPDQKPLVNIRVRLPDQHELDPLTDFTRDRDQRTPMPEAEAISLSETGEPPPRPGLRGATTSETGEPLHPIAELLHLMMLHVNTEEREEFRYETDLIIDSYIGPNSPFARQQAGEDPDRELNAMLEEMSRRAAERLAAAG